MALNNTLEIPQKCFLITTQLLLPSRTGHLPSLTGAVQGRIPEAEAILADGRSASAQREDLNWVCLSADASSPTRISDASLDSHSPEGWHQCSVHISTH